MINTTLKLTKLSEHSFRQSYGCCQFLGNSSFYGDGDTSQNLFYDGQVL